MSYQCQKRNLSLKKMTSRQRTMFASMPAVSSMPNTEELSIRRHVAAAVHAVVVGAGFVQLSQRFAGDSGIHLQLFHTDFQAIRHRSEDVHVERIVKVLQNLVGAAAHKDAAFSGGKVPDNVGLRHKHLVCGLLMDMPSGWMRLQYRLRADSSVLEISDTERPMRMAASLRPGWVRGLLRLAVLQIPHDA